MEPLDPAAPIEPAIVLLDVRGPDAFARGHRPGSGHLPAAELAARRSELPPRGTPLLVLAEDAAHARAAAAAVEALGYAGVRWLDGPAEAMPGGLPDRGPAAPLWRPAPFLLEVLPTVRAALAADRAAPPPRALDLACGAGREAVHLAREGFEVEAWDHAPEALERARDLARRNGVALRTARRDLEHPGPAPAPPFDLVVCFRFLHRPLFGWIEAALAPGGWLVYETFRSGQERFGRPRRAHFLLAQGELSRAFPALETVRHEEPEPPEGPLTGRLLARRPRPGG